MNHSPNPPVPPNHGHIGRSDGKTVIAVVRGGGVRYIPPQSFLNFSGWAGTELF